MSVPLSLMFRHSFPTWHSVEVQEVAKEEVLQESQDECISTPSMVQERSDCTQPSGDGTCASDEPKVGPAADGACAGSHAKEDDVPSPPPGSLLILCSPQPV